MTRLTLALLIALAALPAQAAVPDCATLAEQAAAREGIPKGLMTAIALAESGRADDDGKLRPWPWTLNQGGDGSFHDTRGQALAQLDDLLAQGVTNVDIGCMQINYRWHHRAFESVESMMDPVRNTRYAARFLNELHKRLGSWDAATAAYHSLDAREGALYLDRVSDLAGEASDLGPLSAPVAAHVAGLLALPQAPLIPISDRPAGEAAPATPLIDLAVAGAPLVSY